ncbi:MAG: hypothetical protein MUC97_01405 [Bernardetiaceae bacterium]|jgi:hypothetical protein|nr:hypothetical protein [Bernardetiaceae bacterium]
MFWLAKLRGRTFTFLAYLGIALVVTVGLGYTSLAQWETARQLLDDFPYVWLLTIALGQGHRAILRWLDRPAGWPVWLRWPLVVVTLLGFSLATILLGHYLFIVVPKGGGWAEPVHFCYLFRKHGAAYFVPELLLAAFAIQELWEAYLGRHGAKPAS